MLLRCKQIQHTEIMTVQTNCNYNHISSRTHSICIMNFKCSALFFFAGSINHRDIHGRFSYRLQKQQRPPVANSKADYLNSTNLIQIAVLSQYARKYSYTKLQRIFAANTTNCKETLSHDGFRFIFCAVVVLFHLLFVVFSVCFSLKRFSIVSPNCQVFSAYL